MRIQTFWIYRNEDLLILCCLSKLILFIPASRYRSADSSNHAPVGGSRGSHSSSSYGGSSHYDSASRPSYGSSYDKGYGGSSSSYSDKKDSYSSTGYSSSYQSSSGSSYPSVPQSAPSTTTSLPSQGSSDAYGKRVLVSTQMIFNANR